MNALHTSLHSLGSCWHPGGRALTEHALRLCTFSQGACLLDVGCGAGDTTSYLRERGFTVYGLDTKDRAETHPDVYGAAPHMPFCSNIFDGIVCECVLSLVHDTQTTLEEFRRICRPESVLLLSDVYQKLPSQGKGQLFTDARLQAYLTNAGWRVRHSEDHSHALKKFAAQLAWHGHTCASTNLHKGWSYGLWIATPIDAS